MGRKGLNIYSFSLYAYENGTHINMDDTLSFPWAEYVSRVDPLLLAPHNFLGMRQI